MGYGMAVNLRSKLDQATTFYICDTNQNAIDRFLSETKDNGHVKVVETGAEATQAAVRLILALVRSSNVLTSTT